MNTLVTGTKPGHASSSSGRSGKGPHLRRNAERGAAWAQCQLACRYALGRGVGQDKEEAAKWLSKAAEQGHAKSQYNLGACYLHGLGVARDIEQAGRWASKAAAQGFSQSIELLRSRAVHLLPCQST